MYIDPLLFIHSSFKDAKEFYDTLPPDFYAGLNEQASLEEIIRANRNLIVGEPGIGKTLLLERLSDRLTEDGVQVQLVSLRERNSSEKIDDFVRASDTSRRALLLDGLDEVQASLFPSILKKIREVSQAQPMLGIHLTSRWVLVNRYHANFAEFRFVTISPFTRKQVSKYLTAEGYAPADIDALIGRVMSFRHNMLVIQIPRYLWLLADFIKKHGLGRAAGLSRNDLFEYFIDSKLDLEDERLNADKRALIKRLLEKLALTMEIYQANTILKDDLMTFFDDLESDLKVVALSQLDLRGLFCRTLLKDSQDSVEFDNTEFQEYLAAKEITRFADPRRVAFQFAVDQRIGELQPSWLNTLTFLIDMQPELLEPFVEFSGIRGTKVIDEELLRFLSRVNPDNVTPELKKALFKDLLTYHRRNLQWVPTTTASSLPGFFDPSLENLLRSEVATANTEVGERRFIPLANVASVVGHLLSGEADLERDYWREEMLAIVRETNGNQVARRDALLALEQLGDPSIVEDLPATLFESDESIMRACVTLCARLNPENPVSLNYFVEGTLRGQVEARYGFYALKGKNALTSFLKTFITDESFRQRFLEQASIFGDQDRDLAENIKKIVDDEIAGLCEAAIVQSFRDGTAHFAQQSAFILGLGRLLKDRNPAFLKRILELIGSAEGRVGLYYAEWFFASIIDSSTDVNEFIAAMNAGGGETEAFRTLLQVKLSGKQGADQLFEAGRPILPEQYRSWEAREEQEKADAAAKLQSVLSDFRSQLEPEPGQYNTGVFAFYMHNTTELDALLSNDDRGRLEKLVLGSVFKDIDPADHDLTITRKDPAGGTTYTQSSHISLFRDALLVADHLKLDVAPFRQRVINFIPFAYSKELQAVFRLVRRIEPAEFAAVMSIYRDHSSDLWQHMPDSFIEAVERHHITVATPVLEAFVMETALSSYVRQRALIVYESLASNEEFLKTIVAECGASEKPDDAAVAEVAAGLLITHHGDAEEIRKRLGEVAERAAPFTSPEGAHIVDRLEDEITLGRTFAKPLMELRTPGYEQDYLQLLDRAMSLWTKGKEFYRYAQYLWDIVYAYFDNLKKSGSYAPLMQLERKIGRLSGQEGANWLAARMVNLRKVYLSYLGKPKNIAEAVRKYNSARHLGRKEITDSGDLAQHLREAFETDLSRWVEAEGAYEILSSEKIYATKMQQYEKLVQKTIKSQVENILLKRGFQVDVVREPQLLDEKRTDLLIRYGFAGPVIVEIKLTSNSDLRTTKPEQSASYLSMKKYMEGFGAPHGIFLIFRNMQTKNLERITEAYEQIPNVWVKVFDCHNSFKKVK